jgi:nicotinate-nucleotide pyrophosphorylase (carboxylating)
MSRFDPPAPIVRDIVARAVAEDVGLLGDLTVALLPPGQSGVAEFVARAPGVLAGTACATETFRQLAPAVDLHWTATDGDAVAPGQRLGVVEGPFAEILTAERTALNFLCHLSGVASSTRAFVDAASAHGHARIWDTRKTIPGLRALEKAAVRAGGGRNHRGSLSEMVLVKDNHLGGMTIADAVARARDLWPGRGVEVECERPGQVDAAVAAGADLVMLDNMTPEAAAACVARVRGGARPHTLVEVSGGVTLATVGSYSAAGVDLISTSVITQSAPALDIGLDLSQE